MRSMIPLIAAAGLFAGAQVQAQDATPAPAPDAAAAPAADAAAPAAPADAAPAAPAADAAPAAPAADATPAAPAADAKPAAADAAPAAPAADATPAAPAADAAPVDASAPPQPTGDVLAGLRDIDYISVLGNYVRPDTHRQVDSASDSSAHSGAGASFIFGRHFANNFGWEANYTYNAIETGPNGGGDFYIHNLGADLTYSFGDRQHFTPFLLIGGGGTFDDVHPRQDGGGSGYVDAGLGFTTGTFWHHRIRLRGEARAVHDFISTDQRNGFTDYRAGIGLEIPFYEFKPVALPPQEPPVQVVKTVEVPTGLEDSDGDGVVDSKDKCPNTPPNTRVDGDGCPIPKVLRLEGVTFEFNKARLRPDAQTILDYVVGILKKYPDLQAELAGYTDSVGSAAYNLKLSQKRSEAVKEYLLEKGIEGGRIQAKGYGKENPVAPNDTDEGRERNRRVELHTLN